MSLFAKSRVNQILTFRVTQEQRQKLTAEVERRGISLVDLLREAIDLYFERSAPGSAGSNARPSATTNVNATSVRSPKKSTTRKHSSH